MMGASTEPDTRKSGFAQTGEYDAYIARALATEGGHLSIGRGGATLHFERGRLSGCAEDAIKTAAIAAGLPVIDSRNVPFDEVGSARSARTDDCCWRTATFTALSCALLRAARLRGGSLPCGRGSVQPAAVG